MIEERQASTFGGYTSIVVLFLLQIACFLGVILLPVFMKIILVLVGIVVFICWFGFFMVAPNQGRVMQLFGKYKVITFQV